MAMYARTINPMPIRPADLFYKERKEGSKMAYELVTRETGFVLTNLETWPLWMQVLLVLLAIVNIIVVSSYLLYLVSWPFLTLAAIDKDQDDLIKSVDDIKNKLSVKQEGEEQ